MLLSSIKKLYCYFQIITKFYSMFKVNIVNICYTIYCKQLYYKYLYKIYH